MILATSNGFNSLIVIRFFIGLAEATFYPAIQYVIGSWYKPDELAKRACLFHVRSVSETYLRDSLIFFQTASAIGPMFSGFLQAVRACAFHLRVTFIEFIRQGAYNTLNGVHGLAGWKCM